MFFPAFTHQSPFHDEVLPCIRTPVPFPRRSSSLHSHTSPLSTAKFSPALTHYSPFHNDVLPCTYTPVPFPRRCSSLHSHTSPLSTTLFFLAFPYWSPFNDDVLLCTLTPVLSLNSIVLPCILKQVIFLALSHQSYLSTAMFFLAFSN